MGFLEEMMGEITDRGNKKGSILDIAEGSSATVRFLTDADDILKISIHSRYINGVKGFNYNLPCPLAYGHTQCALEGKDDKKQGGNRDTKNTFGLIVFDYRDSKIKVMFYKANMCSPLERIGNFFSDVGTLLGRDFVITRNTGKGIETRYTVKAGKPAQLPQEAQNIVDSTFPEMSRLIAWEYMKTAIASAYYPGLLKPGAFNLPNNILTDVANPLEDDETVSTNGFVSKPMPAIKFATPPTPAKQSKMPVQKLPEVKETAEAKYGVIEVDSDDELLLDSI